MYARAVVGFPGKAASGGDVRRAGAATREGRGENGAGDWCWEDVSEVG